MKITPNKLIASWNALMDVYSAHQPNPTAEQADPETTLFITQCDRLQMQLRNEIIFWNELPLERRDLIRNDPMTVHFDKITLLPPVYPNDDREALQRFFEPTLPKQQPAMAQLIENKTETKTEEE